MKLNVILTLHEDPAGLDASLASLSGGLRPGDRLIVVDAGSCDGCAERVAALPQTADVGPGVAVQTVLLGTAPRAWRALAVAAGLDQALDPAAFAGPGQDKANDAAGAVLVLCAGECPDPAALSRARDRLADSGADLLIAPLPPTDTLPGDGQAELRLWPGFAAHPPAGARGLTPAPARLLFRLGIAPRAALRQARESGTAFTLLHWQLCTAAARGIVAGDSPLCAPLPLDLPQEPPFALYRQLRRCFPGDTPSDAQQAEVLAWLLRQMAQQMPTLPPARRWDYTLRAAETLAPCPAAVWAAVQQQGLTSPITTALHAGDAVAGHTLWAQQETEARLATMAARLDGIETRIDTLVATAETLRRGIDALCRIAEFDALPPLPRHDPTDGPAE